MPTKILTKEFFQSDDVVDLAKKLIGCRLSTKINGKLTTGIITETEAYAGNGDKACHAYLGRLTKRTATMYKSGGIAYIYLCYGIHHLFNIVTNSKGNADAILIRAFEPEQGIETMIKRRKKYKIDKSLSSGPGNVSQALGLTLNHNSKSICSNEIWLTKTKKIPKIIETTRIGVNYAAEDALLPWRFYDKNSNFVSIK